MLQYPYRSPLWLPFDTGRALWAGQKEAPMERPVSRMLAIPSQVAELNDLQRLCRRLEQAKGFQLKAAHLGDAFCSLELSSQGQAYTLSLYLTPFGIPPLYRCQHYFPDVDAEELEAREQGLAVEMTFGPDPLASYHLQLQVIHTLLPDTLAVMDDSSEKLLSGRWVALAAASHIPPAPRYIYTVQAVSGDESDCVWLHTHGLNRCGITELEVLDSSRQTYESHYHILETMANRLLEEEEPLEPGEPLYLARLTDETALVTTLVPWQDAVGFYDEDLLGGREDREESHNGDTSAVFVYPTFEDFEAGNIAPVRIFDEILAGNPIYMISSQETRRMKALATERLPYLLAALADSRNQALVKLGLTVDEEHRQDQEEEDSREHIWFKVLGYQDGAFTAELTQDPYYIAGLRTGHVGQYPVEQLTDWMLFTPERRITPDDVYMLELD